MNFCVRNYVSVCLALAACVGLHAGEAGTTPQPTTKLEVGNTVYVLWDQPLIRRRDGARAMVTGLRRRKNADGVTSVVIDAQPEEPFAPGDEIYFGPQYPLVADSTDWAQQKAVRVHPEGVNTFAARINTAYRGLNEWSGGILAATALGILPDELDAVRDYVAACNTGQAPAGGSDPFSDHHSTAFVRDFWEAHWETIRSVPRRPTAQRDNPEKQP